jgi:hypothetical protein
LAKTAENCDHNIDPWVTRLGELFSLGSFLKIKEVAKICGVLFPRKKLCGINFDKSELGNILSIFCKLIWSPCCQRDAPGVIQNLKSKVDVVISMFCVFANIRRKNGVYLKKQCFDQIFAKTKSKKLFRRKIF